MDGLQEAPAFRKEGQIPRPLVIGILGVAGSGKTLVSKHLSDRYGYRRTRFADPIKQMLRAIGLTEEEVDGDSKSRPIPRFGGATPRHMMQTLGTDWGRKMVSAEMWVEVWRREAEASTVPIVVDDVRFLNEAQAVRSLCGVLWRVHRPGLASSDAHVSEKQNRMISEDIQIVNATDIPALIASVDAVMEAGCR